MKGLLFDLDGVLYVGDQALPGAGATLDWVRQEGIPHLFLTNTTSRPRSALVEKLIGFGIRIDEDEILTPPVAARHWLAQHTHGPIALFAPEATRSEFAEFTLADDTTQDVAAVVIGDLGQGWDYAVLNRAFRLLMREPQPRLVALGMTRYWQAPEGLRLDVAPFVVALSHASGVEPVVTGKPAAVFFETAADMISCEKQDLVMIGDDIQGDIDGAQRAGIQGIQVRTGKFRDSDLDGDIRPSAVIDSIADLPDWYRTHRSG